MTRAPRNLLLLLAIAVALVPLRAAWHGHSVRTAHDGHVHVHQHAHDGVEHEHTHYHHHGENGDEDHPEDHHGVLDHGESGPMGFWAAPPRTAIDPPPAMGLIASVVDAALGADPLRKAKPPPRATRPRHELDVVRTIILRL